VWQHIKENTNASRVYKSALAGEYILKGSSLLVPVELLKYECTVGAKIAFWGNYFLQINPIFQPIQGACTTGDKFITLDRTHPHFLQSPPRIFKIQTNGGLTILAKVRLTSSPVMNEAIILANSSGNAPLIFLGRAGSKSRVKIVVGDCSATSPLNSLPQNTWMQLVAVYQIINSTFANISLQKDTELIASAVCYRLPVLSDSILAFEVSANSNSEFAIANSVNGMQGDLGVAVVVDKVLAGQTVLEKINGVQEILGFRSVSTKRTAVVNFLPFQYRAALLSLNVSSVLASASGNAIQVSGVYFDSDGNYSCVFSSPSHTTVSSAAVVDTGTLVCAFPPWKAQAGSIVFSIATHSLFSPKVLGSLHFAIQQHWVQFSHDLSSGFDSIGGSPLVITGAGFREQDAYTCDFTRHDGFLESPCVFVNTTQLICTTAPWGKYYSSSWAVIRSSPAHDVSVSIRSAGSLVLRQNLAVTSPPAGCDLMPDSCQMSFYESLDFSELQQGPATGGWALMVKGFGFTNSTYRLNLTSALSASDFVLSGPCEMISVTRLSCPVPLWVFAASDVSVTVVVLEVAGGAYKVKGELIVRLLVRWTGLQNFSVSVSSRGGDVVNVFGVGFSQNISSSPGFACVFRLGDTNLTTRAIWQSFSLLLCPTAPFALGTTTLQIVQQNQICPAEVRCTGTCHSACTPDFVGSFSGLISDGPGPYLPDSECEWLITSQCSNAITLRLDFIDTEACCDHLIVEDFNDGAHVRELTRFSGSANGDASTYTAHSGQMRIRWHADHSDPLGSTFEGFAAIWEVSSTGADVPVPLQGKNSTVVFYQDWPMISGMLPVTGFAGKIFLEITVVGSAFDMRNSYVLRFASRDNSTWVDSKLLRSSKSVLVFEKPIWLLSEDDVANVTCIAASSLVVEGVQANFVFQSHWERKNVSRARASGGEAILIEGWGFSNQATYVCRFSRGSMHLESPAIVQPGTFKVLICGTPFSPLAYGSVEFAIIEKVRVQGGSMDKIVAHMGQNLTEAVVELEQGFERLVATDLPSQNNGTFSGPASGESVVLIHGFGMNANDNYYCRFSRGASILTSAALVLSPQALLCMTPPWGATFEAAQVTVAIEHVPTISWGSNASALACTHAHCNRTCAQECVVHDLSGTHLVRCLSNCTIIDGTEHVVIPCANATSNCTYLFFEVVVESSPSLGLAGGEMNITVTGFGFHENDGYQLFFFAGGFEVSASSLQSNASSIVFAKPIWHAAATTAALSLQSASGMVLRKRPLTFTFQSHWSSINISSASAVGDAVIQVYMCGMTHSYVCCDVFLRCTCY